MKQRFKNRALSHSQLAAFEYNPADWYTTYILGQRTPPTAEMAAGSRIGDSIGTDKSEVPDLIPPGVKEFELHAQWEGISLVGYCDHFCPDMRILHENKTSPNAKRWTQKKVDEHPQLTMYALLLELQHGIAPEDVEMWLNFIPVSLVGVTYKPTLNWRAFETRRTKQDVERYKQYILDTIKKMDEYIRVRSLSPAPRRAPAFNGV